EDELGDNETVLFLAGMLAIFSPILFWQGPLRILLLRPFADKAVSRSLRKFVRKNIAGHGHVVTLSDRYIKDSFLRNSLSISPVRMLGSALSIPLFPLVRLPVARVTLRRPKNMRKLQALLNNRYNLNFHSLFDTI